MTIRDKSGEIQELDSCYHASLREGHYRLQAYLPGRIAAATWLDVPEMSDCKPSTSTIMLTIPR